MINVLRGPSNFQVPTAPQNVTPSLWRLNEPGGLTQRTDQDFAGTISTTSFATYAPVAGWTYANPNGYATNVTDGTAPQGSAVNNFLYPTGYASGGSPASFTFTDSSHKLHVYTCLAWAFSHPWTYSNNSVTKILLYSEGSSDIYLCLYNQSDVAARLAVVTEYPSDNRTLQCNRTSTMVTPTAYHVVEWELICSSTGSTSDGVVRVWLDNVLQIEYTDLKMNVASGFNAYEVYGGYGAGPPKVQDDYYRYNHLYLSAA